MTDEEFEEKCDEILEEIFEAAKSAIIVEYTKGLTQPTDFVLVYIVDSLKWIGAFGNDYSIPKQDETTEKIPVLTALPWNVCDVFACIDPSKKAEILEVPEEGYVKFFLFLDHENFMICELDPYESELDSTTSN